MEKKRIILWGAVIIGIFGFLWLLTSLAARSTTNMGGAELSDAIVIENEHVKGNPNASITIVEYSDFQCPACASTYPRVAQTIDDYGDDVRLIYRHFPLSTIHPHARLAAEASEAAGLQGDFWGMHDALFNTQAQWSSSNDPEAFFIRLAESIGLDANMFASDLNSDAVRDAVSEDAKSADALRLGGTPTFFVNNVEQSFPSYGELDALINSQQ